jgi:hypothetical protein
MGLRHAVVLAMATGLAGCATDPYGMRYSDGSYYAGEGGGDYYVGRAYDNRRYAYDPFFDPRFDWLFYGGPAYGAWYGSPFHGYDGYCSVRYRYCPRRWADPFPRYDFHLYFDDPWYRGYDPRWHPPRRRPPPAQAPAPDGELPDWRDDRDDRDDRDARGQPPPERARRSPRGPMVEDRPDAGDARAPRARRGPAPRREPPPPRKEDADGDGN